jgi:N-methylhydantoinase B
MQYEIIGSANGATRGMDGCDGVLPPGANFSVVPVEVLEGQFPVRVQRFELIPDTGGAGEYRGGMSYRREYEFLCQVEINRRADRQKFPGPGIFGGLPGTLAHQWIQRVGEKPEPVNLAGQYRLSAGDRIIIEGGGAGGWGDPQKRDPQLVLADVLDGLVSIHSAAADYGVVVEDRTVDQEATAALRSRLEGERSGIEDEIEVVAG